MSLLDAVFGPLLGRTRLQKPDMDRLFKLSTAGPSLDGAELAPDGRWAVCLQSVEGADFAQVERDLRQLVEIACRGQDFHSRSEIQRDNLGYTWVVFSDPELENGVTLVHLVGSTLQEQGYGEQLLAAVFRFRQEPPDAGAGPRYLLYNYKRGKFYPFVPLPGHERDNAAEFRIGSALGRLLPVEPDLTRWYPLWDCPV
jgi:hypothetical protein